MKSSIGESSKEPAWLPWRPSKTTTGAWLWDYLRHSHLLLICFFAWKDLELAQEKPKKHSLTLLNMQFSPRTPRTHLTKSSNDHGSSIALPNCRASDLQVHAVGPKKIGVFWTVVDLYPQSLTSDVLSQLSSESPTSSLLRRALLRSRKTTATLLVSKAVTFKQHAAFSSLMQHVTPPFYLVNCLGQGMNVCSFPGIATQKQVGLKFSRCMALLAWKYVKGTSRLILDLLE